MAGRGNQMDTSQEMASSDKPRSIPLARNCREQALPEGGFWRKQARGHGAR
jgi:hypothetical protein